MMIAQEKYPQLSVPSNDDYLRSLSEELDKTFKMGDCISKGRREPHIVNLGTSRGKVYAAGVISLCSLAISGSVQGEPRLLEPCAMEFAIDDYLKEDERVNEYINEYLPTRAKVNKTVLVERILSFKVLEQNWDGNDGIPLECSSAANAIHVVYVLSQKALNKLTDVYPNNNGTVTMLWVNNSGERISIGVGNKTFSYYCKLNVEAKPLFFNDLPLNTKSIKQLEEHISSL